MTPTEITVGEGVIPLGFSIFAQDRANHSAFSYFCRRLEKFIKHK